MILSFPTLVLSFSLLFAQQEIEEKALLEESKGEALFFSVEEFVTTAGRMEQRIEEAPVAITVITEEDIRCSGANSIPEVLRAAAGVDVVTLTAFDSEANVRGFSMPWTNKLLVLIDGRYTYEDFLGITVWNSFPIQLGDIKKIEIIKGPGSVLYGANAYSGVVNIITKSPEESKGAAASLAGGQFNHYIASVIYGGKINDLEGTISGGLEQAGRFSEHDEISLKGGKARGQLKYKISGESSASLDGGIVSSKGEQFILAPDVIAGNNEGYIKANYNYSNLKAQAFWRERRINFDIVNSFRLPSFLNLEPAHLVCDIYDIEAQHLFKLEDFGNIMAGLNYRLVTLESNYLQSKDVNLYAGFLQYELKPIQNLILNAGVRLDKQDYMKLHTSPRGAIIFTPYKNHTIRASISTAFRNPTFVDAYPDITISFPPPFAGGIAVIGNKELKPERITSYDLGYHTTLFQRLKATVDLFYYEMSDFIRTWGDQYTDDKGWIYKYSINKGTARGAGGEIGFEYLITSWLKGLFNYSYQKITDQDETKILDNPNNKFNVGARLKISGLSANIIAHYVGPTRQEYTVTAFPPTTKKEDLDSYVLLNARVGYSFFNEHIEVALSGQNLLNYENYKGKLYNFPNADPIPLMLLGTINVKF